METERFLKNLEVPEGPVDVVLDTDAYNEIDDQFAIAYLLRSVEKLKTRAMYAAPFLNKKSVSVEDGMEKSYQEILKVMRLCGAEDTIPVMKGSRGYLTSEKTPQESDAAHDLVKRAMTYTQESPLYVVAIGAITNIASALLLEPQIKDRIVLVWLGGHAHNWPHNIEFNLRQDVAAARVVFGCGVPLVQLPCNGVVDSFHVSGPELKYWLAGKNELCDYLCQNTINEAESYAAGKVWSRVIWDTTAVGWLLNDESRFMESHLEFSPIPEYDHRYSYDKQRHFIRYVYSIRRDALLQDMVNKLTR